MPKAASDLMQLENLGQKPAGCCFVKVKHERGPSFCPKKSGLGIQRRLINLLWNQTAIEMSQLSLHCCCPVVIRTYYAVRNPAGILPYRGVHAWSAGPSTADPPAHHAGQLVPAARVAGQRTSRVSLRVKTAKTPARFTSTQRRPTVTSECQRTLHTLVSTSLMLLEGFTVNLLQSWLIIKSNSHFSLYSNSLQDQWIYE